MSEKLLLSSMGLPKKAKAGSKSKSKGGKDKDGKPKEPKKPQITVSNARMPAPDTATLTAARPVSYNAQARVPRLAQFSACRPVAPELLGPTTDISWVRPAKQLLLLSKTFRAGGCIVWECSLAAARLCTAVAGYKKQPAL